MIVPPTREMGWSGSGWTDPLPTEPPPAPKLVPRIVINYRRDDSKPWAHRLYDRLQDDFGREHVFVDIDRIQPGDDFVEAITRVVDECDVFIATIGPRWASATDATGRRRLEDPKDFVRLEIALALKRKVWVIPVLVAGAVMPSEEDLPKDIAGLARRQAVHIRRGPLPQGRRLPRGNDQA